MVQTKPERKIAAAIVKMFREHLDAKVKPLPLNGAMISQIERSIDENFGALNLSQDIREEIRTLMIEINSNLSISMEPVYEEQIQRLLEYVMPAIEALLVSQLTQEELTEIAEYIEKDSFKKFLQMTIVCSILLEQKSAIKAEIKKSVAEKLKEYNYKDRLNEIMAKISTMNNLGSVEGSIEMDDPDDSDLMW